MPSPRSPASGVRPIRGQVCGRDFQNLELSTSFCHRRRATKRRRVARRGRRSWSLLSGGRFFRRRAGPGSGWIGWIGADWWAGHRLQRLRWALGCGWSPAESDGRPKAGPARRLDARPNGLVRNDCTARTLKAGGPVPIDAARLRFLLFLSHVASFCLRRQSPKKYPYPAVGAAPGGCLTQCKKCKRFVLRPSPGAGCFLGRCAANLTPYDTLGHFL